MTGDSSRSLSNTFTLFMKYFIRAIANAKNKSQRDALCLSSWSCGMPAPAFQLPLRKRWMFVHETHVLWFPPPPFFNKYRDKEKTKGEKKTWSFQTKETIWSVRNQIPLWDVFNPHPFPTISTTKQVKKKKITKIKKEWILFYCQSVHRNKINFRKRLRTVRRLAPPTE